MSVCLLRVRVRAFRPRSAHLSAGRPRRGDGAYHSRPPAGLPGSSVRQGSEVPGTGPTPSLPTSRIVEISRNCKQQNGEQNAVAATIKQAPKMRLPREWISPAGSPVLGNPTVLPCRPWLGEADDMTKWSMYKVKEGKLATVGNPNTRYTRGHTRTMHPLRRHISKWGRVSRNTVEG